MRELICFFFLMFSIQAVAKEEGIELRDDETIAPRYCSDWEPMPATLALKEKRLAEMRKEFQKKYPASRISMTSMERRQKKGLSKFCVHSVRKITPRDYHPYPDDPTFKPLRPIRRVTNDDSLAIAGLFFDSMKP